MGGPAANLKVFLTVGDGIYVVDAERMQKQNINKGQFISMNVSVSQWPAAGRDF